MALLRRRTGTHAVVKCSKFMPVGKLMVMLSTLGMMSCFIAWTWVGGWLKLVKTFPQPPPHVLEPYAHLQLPSLTDATRRPSRYGKDLKTVKLHSKHTLHQMFYAPLYACMWVTLFSIPKPYNRSYCYMHLFHGMTEIGWNSFLLLNFLIPTFWSFKKIVHPYGIIWGKVLG